MMLLPRTISGLNRTCISLLLLVILLGSCQKEASQSVPEPTPGSKNIQISFGVQSMNVAAVDSVIVMFTKPGQAELIKEKCIRQDNIYTASLDKIAAGNWKMHLEIYTNGAKQNFLFTYDQDIRLPLSYSLTISAPDKLFSANWRSWLFVKDPAYVLRIPLDPANPYFEISVNNPTWDYIYIERNIRDQQSQVLLTADWECAGNCFDAGLVLKNQVAFAGFAQQAQGKNWKQGEISIFLINDAGGIDHTIYRLYDQ